MKWSPSCLQKDKGGFFIYTDFVQCILKKEWWAMYQVKNFTDSKDVKKIAQLGGFSVIEYQRDLSVFPDSAMTAYFCSQMNVRKRQLVCEMSNSQVTIQAGSMQWMLGNVNATTGIKGVGDLFGKAIRGKVTGESAIKPD